MPVVIEELQAEVAPPPAASPNAPEAPAQAETLDERKLLEALARECWGIRRLVAD